MHHKDLLPTDSFGIEFSTTDAGYINVVKITIERDVMDAADIVRVDLADHPLYPSLARYVRNNPRPTQENIEQRVTLERINEVVVKETIEAVPGTTITIATLHLRNGAKAIGINYGAIDPAVQDWAIGAREAKKQAYDKVYELEGYLLRERLSGRHG
ncbi:MAG: hypothetical protein JSR28_15355 [Proteobacteria bacterium]|nr:hypothetical protein [Pseudomonadota bacterium]